MARNFRNLLCIKLALCYLNFSITALSNHLLDPFSGHGQSFQDYWDQHGTSDWYVEPGKPSSYAQGSLEEDPDFFDISLDDLYKPSRGRSGPDLLTQNAISARLTPEKRRKMEEPEGSQRHKSNQDTILTPRKTNRPPGQAVSRETQAKGSHKSLATDKFQLLSRSEHTQECLQLAEIIYHKYNYDEQVAHYEAEFETKREKAEIQSGGFRISSNNKIELEGLPIVIIKHKAGRLWTVRLPNGDPSETQQPLHYQLTFFKTQFTELINALDLVYAVAYQGKLDKIIRGRSNNLAHSLVEWFQRIIFEGTEDSMPLLGSVELEDLPKGDNYQQWFGDAQKYLSVVLTDPIYREKINLCDAAISLLAFWYQNVAPKKKKTRQISDEYFWELMRDAAQKHYVSLAKKELGGLET